MQVIAEPVVGRFTPDAAVTLAGGQYLRGYIWDSFFAGVQFSFSGYFCACGRSGLSFLHNFLSIVLARIPGGLRRLAAVCADASADGACKRGRVAVFDPCVCLRLSDSDAAAGAASTGGLNIQYDGMFLVLEKEDAFEGDVTELGRSLCVRVRFRGSHLQSPEQYARLLAYTEAHGLTPAGFSREITLVDYGLTSDPEKFVTEITIPVRPAG